MSAPAPIDAVFLDLFDTVVRLARDRLPLTRTGDREFPSTIPFLLPLLREHTPQVGELDVARALRSMYRDLREQVGGDHTETHSGVRFGRLARALGVPEDDCDALGAELSDLHMTHLTGIAVLPEGHREALVELAARRPLVLVSNFDHAAWGHRLIARLELAQHFDHVVISDELGVRKPHPRLFTEPAARLGVAPERVLFVGDTPESDVVGAAAVGMRTAWIRPVGKPWPAAIAPPDHEIEHLRELLPLVP